MYKFNRKKKIFYCEHFSIKTFDWATNVHSQYWLLTYWLCLMLTYWLIPFPQQRINFKTSIQDPNFARENLQPYCVMEREGGGGCYCGGHTLVNFSLHTTQSVQILHINSNHLTSPAKISWKLGLFLTFPNLNANGRSCMSDRSSYSFYWNISKSFKCSQIFPIFRI